MSTLMSVRSGTHSAGFLRCRAINSLLSSKINEGFVAMGNYLFLKNVLKVKVETLKIHPLEHVIETEFREKYLTVEKPKELLNKII